MSAWSRFSRRRRHYSPSLRRRRASCLREVKYSLSTEGPARSFCRKSGPDKCMRRIIADHQARIATPLLQVHVFTRKICVGGVYLHSVSHGIQTRGGYWRGHGQRKPPCPPTIPDVACLGPVLGACMVTFAIWRKVRSPCMPGVLTYIPVVVLSKSALTRCTLCGIGCPGGRFTPRPEQVTGGG